MADPAKQFKKTRRQRVNPFDFRYVRNFDGEFGATYESIQAKDPNNRNIGDRHVTRFINPERNDTLIRVFPSVTNNGYPPFVKPIAIYTNGSDNWQSLNQLFDIIKNSRPLDSSGYYVTEKRNFEKRK